METAPVMFIEEFYLFLISHVMFVEGNMVIQNTSAKGSNTLAVTFTGGNRTKIFHQK